MNSKYPAASNLTINMLCNIMLNDSLGVELNRLAFINTLILNVYEQKCLDFKYNKMINILRNITWESEASEGGRQWMYQTCTEFGFYQTSTNQPQLFGHQFPIEFFIQQCLDIFGMKFNQQFILNKIKQTNIVYGGLNIIHTDSLSNVVFVHGSIDPWHALGIIHSENNKAPSIYINGKYNYLNIKY